MREWSLQNAKNKFSDLFKAALDGEPQRVSSQEQGAVVILSASEYDCLRQMQESHISSFSELLLEMPQDDLEFDRLGIAHTPTDL